MLPGIRSGRCVDMMTNTPSAAPSLLIRDTSSPTRVARDPSLPQSIQLSSSMTSNRGRGSPGAPAPMLLVVSPFAVERVDRSVDRAGAVIKGGCDQEFVSEDREG